MDEARDSRPDADSGKDVTPAPASPPPPEPAPKPRVSRLEVGILLFLVACTMLGNGLVVPILTIYGAEFSASATMVGMLITVFGLARLSTNLPTGFIYRRVGSRALMVVGTGLLLVGAIGAALAPNLSLLLVSRVVQGIGSGFFLTTIGIVFARRSEPATRGRFLALYQASVHIGASIGPVVGGLIAQSFGLSAPFWAYAMVALLALFVSLRSADDRAADTGAKAGGAGGRDLIRELLTNPGLQSGYLLGIASGFSRTGVHWQLLPLLATERFQMGFGTIGIVITVISLANLTLLPLGGWMVDKVGARIMAPFACAALAAALCVLAYSATPTAFWIGAMILGASGGILMPAAVTSVVESSPPALLPPAMGGNRFAGDLGFVAGPLVIGLVIDAGISDVPGGFLLTAGMVLAVGLFTIWARLLRPRQNV